MGQFQAQAASATVQVVRECGALDFSGLFARGVSLVGGGALLLRRLNHAAPEPAWGSAPAIPEAKPQGHVPTLKMPTARRWGPGRGYA